MMVYEKRIPVLIQILNFEQSALMHKQ